MSESTTAAILAAIGAVNDNIVATREGLHQFREEMNLQLGLIRVDVRDHGTQIEALERTNVADHSFLKGIKMPMVAGGALVLVLADHWEHGKSLFGWLLK